MLSKASTIVIIAAAAIAAAVLFSTSSQEMRTRGKDNRTTPTENIKSKSNHTYRMPSPASPEGYFPTNDNRASSVTTANTPPSKEESVAAIHAAAITYDPAFLANIAPHLNSPDPDVRAAAAEGIVVLGDSAGSALLRQAAKTARSGEEAAELREKADYLELPSATPDLLRKMKALNGRRAAGRQLAIPPAPNSTRQSTRP